MIFKNLARFPMSSGHLTRAVNVPNAQTRGGIGTLWYISLVHATPCAQNKNGTCHLQLMALLMARTANYVNRYAHEMGQSLNNRGAVSRTTPTARGEKNEIYGENMRQRNILPPILRPATHPVRTYVPRTS